MKEKPILFSAPMVQAILSGAKAQTRRILKCDYEIESISTTEEWSRRLSTNPCFGRPITDEEISQKANNLKGRLHPVITADHQMIGLQCPHGQPGDQLWVREKGWERPYRTAQMLREGADTWKPYYYDADGLNENDIDDFKSWGFKRRPSIHMPRWASRIQLEITDIRIERLQDISDEDAIAEGIERSDLTINGTSEGNHYRDYLMNTDDICEWFTNPISSFESLWKSINGTDSWQSNPWVWVVEFNVINLIKKA